MARRQEAKERFLSRQRKVNEAKTGDTGGATPNNDNAAAPATDNDSSKYYTITDPFGGTEAGGGTASAAASMTSATATDDGDKNDKKDDDDEEGDGKPKATPIKKIAIHSTSAAPGGAGRLDIFTYHRGRAGQEPRDARTGELLCDTDPLDTNHNWNPPETTVVKVNVKFPLVDPNEEEYEDSDLEVDEEGNEVVGVAKSDGGEKESSPPSMGGELLNRSDSTSGGGRPSRSRAARQGSSVLSADALAATSPTASANASQSNNLQQHQQQQSNIPYFTEVVQWDLSDPTMPTPEEYSANIATQFGLSFPQTMDLKESIERQLADFVRSQPQFYAPISLLDPYGADRPVSHFGPPERHCGPVVGSSFNNARPTIRRTGSSVSRSSGGPRRGLGRVVPDRRGYQVVPKGQVAKAGEGDPYSTEVIRRATAQSRDLVAEAKERGEATLAITHNEVCHICHNRKELGLTFHCGRHTYCDMHCAVS